MMYCTVCMYYMTISCTFSLLAEKYMKKMGKKTPKKKKKKER